MPQQDKHELIYQTLLAMYRLLDERLPQVSLPVNTGGPGSPDPADPVRTDPADPPPVEAEDLMTIRQAYLELNVSRTTISNLRQQGLLTSLYHNHSVRLLRSEVMAAKRWYSHMKGKV